MDKTYCLQHKEYSENKKTNISSTANGQTTISVPSVAHNSK